MWKPTSSLCGVRLIRVDLTKLQFYRYGYNNVFAEVKI